MPNEWQRPENSSKQMNIVVQLLQIITLKRSPSDISYDPNTAVMAFIAAVAISFLQLLASQQISTPLPFVTTQNLAQAAVFWLILRINDKENRYIQAATALFGVSAMLQLVVLALMQVPTMIVFGVIISGWNFYLLALILSTAIDAGIGRSLIITFAYHIAIGFLLTPLFPEQYEQIQNAWTTMQS